MLNNEPLISVIIPVKNGANTLNDALQGVFSQKLINCVEVIIINSGSTDDTLDIAKKYPVRIHEIPPEEFNHGATRNLGVALAHGEFVVLTVQDAIPADDEWISKMLKHFKDPDVAGVCGRQIIPHDKDKNPLEWSRTFSEPVSRKVCFKHRSEYQYLTDMEKRSICSWDDVTAMYRRSTLLKVPFRPAMFAEDALWANDALENGYAIIYEPNATVYHYHFQTFSFRFKRMLTVYYHDTIFWGSIRHPRKWWKTSAQILFHLAKNPQLSLSDKLYWLFYNIIQLSAEWSAYLICSIANGVPGNYTLTKLHDAFCKTAPIAVRHKQA